MKTIAVAGGAGMVGSHLCRRLLQDANVICIDNFYTGNRRNIEDLFENPRFKFILHDVEKPLKTDVSAISAIYNLASPASPIHYKKDPIKTVKTNVLGAINMLELAKENGAKILQASTSEVYGDPFVHPQKESYWGNVNPTGVRSCYDEGKRCAETLFFDYWRRFGVRIKVARIFNTYGPATSVDDGRAVSNFINQALRNENLTIYGSGNQTRCFCFVSDLVDALIRFMDSDDSVVGPANLGSADEITINELAEKIVRLTNSSAKIVHLPSEEDDPQRRKPDISFIEKLTGWKPRTSFDEGLKKTVDYFKSLK